MNRAATPLSRSVNVTPMGDRKAALHFIWPSMVHQFTVYYLRIAGVS
jgi:hypothetical protein